MGDSVSDYRQEAIERGLKTFVQYGDEDLSQMVGQIIDASGLLDRIAELEADDQCLRNEKADLLLERAELQSEIERRKWVAPAEMNAKNRRIEQLEAALRDIRDRNWPITGCRDVLRGSPDEGRS